MSQLAYVISTLEYEDSVVLGVYLDREKAIEAASHGYACYIAPIGAVITSEAELKVIHNLERTFAKDVDEFKKALDNPRVSW